MNLYIKKISTLAGVGVISILSTFQSFTNVDAALTAPSSWDFKYTNEDFPGFKLRNTTSVISTPQYTRTADGIYYNYTVDFEVVSGLNITQTFNRSNTSWYQNGSVWIPSAASVGSDNTVGSIQHKIYFKFHNQTQKNYLLKLDVSSTSIARYRVQYNNDIVLTNFDLQLFDINSSYLATIFIPAFTTTEIFRIESSLVQYFDAWYLEDLGISTAYDEGQLVGYDEGFNEGYSAGLNNNPNVLLNGFQAMVGILVNFMLLILNLNVFGVSILSVFSIIALFVGFIWILKIIRG
jgi:hypothetical protein